MFSTLVGNKGCIVRVKVHWFSIMEMSVSGLCASLIAVLVKNWRWWLRFVGQLKIPLGFFFPFPFVQTPNLTLWVSSGQPLHLVSALSDDGSASGDLFWDDGESMDTYETNQYAYVIFNVSQVLCNFLLLPQSSAWVELVWQSFDLICMLS